MIPFLTFVNYAAVVVVAVAVLMVFWKYVKPEPPKVLDVRPQSCQQGDHRWRYIAHPYAKQCSIKSCGAVVYNSDFVPDGLREYMDMMTRKEGAERFYLKMDERGELATWICECDDSTEDHEFDGVRFTKCLRIGCRCQEFKTKTALKLPEWFKIGEVEQGPEPRRFAAVEPDQTGIQAEPYTSIKTV